MATSRSQRDDLRAASDSNAALLRRALLQVPEPVLLIEVGTKRIVGVNTPAADLLSLSQDELRQLTLLDVSVPVLPDGRDPRVAGADLAQQAAVGHMPRMAWALRNADGRPIACELRAVLTVLDDMAVLRISIDRPGDHASLNALVRRLGVVLDCAPHEVYVFDTDTLSIRQANQTAHRNLGCGADELLGTPIWSLAPRVSAAAFRDLLMPLLNGETDGLIFETAHRRTDGSIYPVDMQVHLLPNESPAAFVAFALDVSDRKRTEAELDNSRRRLGDFLSASADWLWETDEEHRFTFFSKNAELITGVSVETEYGRRRDQDADPDDGADWDAHWRTLDAHEPFRDFVYRRSIPGHKAIWLRTSGVPIFDEDNKFCGYRGVGSDVTLIKEAELAAQRYERRFRDLIDASLQGIYVHRGWKLLFANQAMARMLGYDSVEELMSLGTIHPFFDPSDHAGLMAITDARISGEDIPAVCDVTYLRRDGSKLVTEHVANVLDWEGEPAILATIADIEDRRRYEEAIQQARDKAEGASQAKSNFLALMSHELRTPLNAILGFSQIIRDGVLGPVGNGAYLEYAGDIYDSGQHLLNIINDILDISKIEAGHEGLEEAVIDLQKIIESALRLIEPIAHSHGVAMAGPARLPNIKLFADEMKLKQVLINVLNNAVKFTPNGGRVDLQAKVAESGDLELRVIDTGIGMSAAEIDIALTPFGQVENTTQRYHAGVGLGLPIADKLVELHGGSLTLTSTPDAGTCVVVTLPASRIEQPSRRDTDSAAV